MYQQQLIFSFFLHLLPSTNKCINMLVQCGFAASFFDYYCAAVHVAPLLNSLFIYHDGFYLSTFFLLMQAKVSFINKKVIDLYIEVNIIIITLENFRRISRTIPLEEFKSNDDFPSNKVKKKTICSSIQQYFLCLQNRKG